jgi:hypothetical protein
MDRLTRIKLARLLEGKKSSPYTGQLPVEIGMKKNTIVIVHCTNEKLLGIKHLKITT